MARILRYMGYFFLFVISFVVFLYWSLPYDILKDRVVESMEEQAGGKYQISVKKFAPYWVTGIELIDLSVLSAGDAGGSEILKIKEARGRASIISLLLRKPNVSFSVDMGKSDLSGDVSLDDEGMDLNVDFDNLDLKDLKVVTDKIGLNLSSKIDGDVRLKVDRQRPIRSEGSIAIDLDSIKIEESKLKHGEMEFDVPALTLTQSSGSQIKLEMSKGTLQVSAFKLTGGDLEIDLTGKVFLSNNYDNYRFNLSGSFKVSEALEKALPFLFVVEKQKKEDGTYPISITGRLAKPMIKIGTFTLPI